MATVSLKTIIFPDLPCGVLYDSSQLVPPVPAPEFMSLVFGYKYKIEIGTWSPVFPGRVLTARVELGVNGEPQFETLDEVFSMSQVAKVIQCLEPGLGKIISEPDHLWTLAPEPKNHSTLSLAPDHSSTLSPENLGTLAPDHSSTLSLAGIMPEPDHNSTLEPDHSSTIAPAGIVPESGCFRTSVYNFLSTLVPENFSLSALCHSNPTTIEKAVPPRHPRIRSTPLLPKLDWDTNPFDDSETLAPENFRTVELDHFRTVELDHLGTLAPENLGTLALEPKNHSTLAQAGIMPTLEDISLKGCVEIPQSKLRGGREYVIIPVEGWIPPHMLDKHGFCRATVQICSVMEFKVEEGGNGKVLFIPLGAAIRIYEPPSEKTLYELALAEGQEFMDIDFRNIHLPAGQKCYIRTHRTARYLLAYVRCRFFDTPYFEYGAESRDIFDGEAPNSTLSLSQVAQCKIALSDLPTVKNEDLEIGQSYGVRFNSKFPKLREKGFLVAVARQNHDAHEEDYFKVEGLVGAVKLEHLDIVVPYTMVQSLDDEDSRQSRFSVKHFMNFYEGENL